MYANYSKDFDRWNTLKKETDLQSKRPFYKEREVWRCILGVNIGFEQDGKGPLSLRPVLIVKGLSRLTCLIVPLTTSMKANRYHFAVGTFSGGPSYAILSQIRFIDDKRLHAKMGMIDEVCFDGMRKAIKEFL